MKKLTVIFLAIFCISFCNNILAQSKKKQVVSQPATPSLNDLQKTIDAMSPEEKAMMKKMGISSNVNEIEKSATSNYIDKNKSNPQIDNVTGKSKQARDAFEKLVMSPSSIELKRGETVFFEVSTVTFVHNKQEIESSVEPDAMLDDERLTRQEHSDYLDKQMKAADKLNPTNPDYSKINPDEIAPETIERHRRERGSEEVRKNHDAEMNRLLMKDDKESGNNSPVTPDFEITAWKMNGLTTPVSNQFGQLEGANHFGIYKAPTVVPLNNIRFVEITCELIYKKTKEKFTLKSQVILLVEGWFKAKIDGKEWYAPQLLDQKYIAAVQGENFGQIKSAEAFYSDGSLGPKGLILSITNGFPKTLTLHIKEPHLHENIIDCNSEGTSLYMIDWAATLNSYIVVNRGNGACEYKDVCEKLTVNLTSLNLKTGGLVAGSFSGILYSSQKCQPPIEHKISGSFSLSIVSTPATNMLNKIFESNQMPNK